MEVFARNWEPMHQMGELGPRHLELFQRSLGIMLRSTLAGSEDAAAPGSEDDDATQADLAAQVRDLGAQLKEMQRRLDTLTRRRVLSANAIYTE